MNMKELKAELKRQNLKIIGNKQTLQVRLQEAVKNNVPIFPPVSASFPVSKEDKGNKITTGFPSGAYWKVLHHVYVQVIEPSNPTFKPPRAPTVPEEDDMKVPTKRISLKILIGQCGKGGWISLSSFLQVFRKNRDGTDA